MNFLLIAQVRAEVLIVGSAAGVAAMSMEKIDFSGT